MFQDKMEITTAKRKTHSNLTLTNLYNPDLLIEEFNLEGLEWRFRMIF